MVTSIFDDLLQNEARLPLSSHPMINLKKQITIIIGHYTVHPNQHVCYYSELHYPTTTDQ